MTPPSKGPGVIDAMTLAPLYGEEVLLHTVRDTHRAIAARAFGATGSLGRVPRRVHDGVTEAVYSGIGLGLAGAAVALKAAGQAGRTGPPLAPRIQSAITGVVGERLRDEAHPMHFEMAVRLRGEDVPVDHVHLAAAYPAATGDLVVFLHGLCESESAWEHGQLDSPTYPQTVAAQGWSPVLLRFNSGLSVRENGAALASLLQALVDAWPVGVRRIALVGHSMGGLVIRAACAIGGDHDWPALVTDAVYLGTPHLGAPLARQAMLGGRLLKLLPESAALGRVIDHRSVGITNLELGLTEDVPSLEHARVRLVSAQLKGVAGLLLGDLLVGRASAHGRSRRAPELFPEADAVHLVNTNHFGLLNHPDVHARLKEWLS